MGLSLLLSLGALGIITLVSLSAILTQLRNFSNKLSDTETALRSDVVGRNLANAAADTITDIDLFLLERIQDVRRMSEEPSVVAAARSGSELAENKGIASVAMNSEQVDEILGDALFLEIDPEIFAPALSFVFLQTERSETPFIEILVTEAHGVNLLITRPIEIRSHIDQEWWQEATNPSLAGIGIQSPTIDPATQKPVLGIALPIIDRDTKEIVGVIRAVIQLNGLQQSLAQKAASLTADIQLFTSEGLLLADTGSNDQGAILNVAFNVISIGDEPSLAAQSARPGATGAGFQIITAPESRIVGYAHSADSDFYDNPAALSGFPGFSFGLTVSQTEDRALLVLEQLIRTGQDFAGLPLQLGTTFIVLAIFIAALAITGAVFVSSSVTRPLVELNRMSNRLQNGDLHVRVNIESNDEVGELGRAFNAMAEGLQQRERERDIFGRVVSPQVREKLLSGDLELGGETRWVTVLFCDIRNFSTMSEKLSPQEVVTFLNEYLSEMSDAVLPWGGYINNFIGDAIVAIFGAPVDQPDKTWRAVAAAIEMRERLQSLNQRRIARGEQPIDSGIGISTGEVVAGQIGSLERLLYTVIGDAVNVAARLETLTKEYPQYPILMNNSTAETILRSPTIQLASLGAIHVKGRSEAVEVFAVQSWQIPLRLE
jgi:class 3 adenylate cyclase